MFKRFVQYALNHPRLVMGISAALLLVALFQFPKIRVDTDPENMLPDDAPVRMFHAAMKQEFAMYDMVVLGIVNNSHPQGVFNPATLAKIYQLTEDIKKINRVISHEIVAPSTKDNIEQAGPGSVTFNWLMAEPPQTQEEASHIRDEAMDHPMFRDSVVSGDGRAMIIYIPIEAKNASYQVAQEIRSLTDKLEGAEEYHITGLPVANDQFGVEMFKQMAFSAPLAGLIIFLLMWYFFKSAQLVVAPMLVAIFSVVLTMGLLIGMGYPVHIMSSMIPIFLMPIAVLDSVHILSELFDKYPQFRDRQKTILHIMEELFKPMLFTSLTSAVGFFSLSFSPIPPVQVFGIFVAIGVMLAWVLTLLFIPAYVMLMNEKAFENFGNVGSTEKSGWMDAMLSGFRRFSSLRPKLVLTLTVILVAISAIGISRIQVNDNPVRWFKSGHPIRVADKVLNEHFSGTYEAYLVLDAREAEPEAFLDPEVLRYVETLQNDLAESGMVGKTMSLADIVKKVYDELLGGDGSHFVIPSTREAVAQSLISFENSHKPDDLWHLVTPDYSKLNIWFQLKSGDNKDMSALVKWVEHYMQNHPAPISLRADWAGLTYINVVWQNNMVIGMLKNFLGSFGIVFVMMIVLFRSLIKALISMIPLSVTIVFIYSLLGFFGKDYDMPVAVLSALTLGLSIDFAIHFIQRATEVQVKTRDWLKTVEDMFGGPGRAIFRNALVIAIGFLPLLVAPLVPYVTVGFFMFMIMAVSSLATLLMIPALISVVGKRFFGIQKTEEAK